MGEIRQYVIKHLSTESLAALLISTIGIALSRFLNSPLWGRIQLAFWGTLILFSGFYVWSKLKSHGYVATVLGSLVVWVFTLILASSLHVRALAIPIQFPRQPDLEARLGTEFPLRIHGTRYNEITILRRPLVTKENNNTLRLLIDFLWTKRQYFDRTYSGTLILKAEYRKTETGGDSWDPPVVEDISMSPRQGSFGYLFSWFEEWSLRNESSDFIGGQWVYRAMLE